MSRCRVGGPAAAVVDVLIDRTARRGASQPARQSATAGQGTPALNSQSVAVTAVS